MDTYKLIYIFSFTTVYFAECYGADPLHKNTGLVTVNELSITSNVSIRYAKVLLRSLVKNSDSKSHEVSFEVRIPHEAYITSFTIVTNEKTIHAYITEKVKAAEEYNQAKENNVTAGIVTQKSKVADDMDRDIFSVKVNVAAKSSLKFRLEYEELLRKNAGIYSQILFVDTDHIIPYLEIVCEFKEKQKFKRMVYKSPLDAEKMAINGEEIDGYGNYIKKIVWRPSETDQESAFLEKPFEIQYELEPPEDGGIVFLNGKGEFVHMFSTPCEETKIMMKQIVFVIDISGSMKGEPIKLVLKTIIKILTQLRTQDYFNIIVFNDKSRMWRRDFQPASLYNIADAKAFVETELVAGGATNINDALLGAISLFGSKYESVENDRSGQMIVFLTDGETTTGERNLDKIRTNARRMNYYESDKCCKSSIYTIAFGKGADVDFLAVLASEHSGTLTIVRESSVENNEMLELYHGLENPYYKEVEFTFRVGNEIIPAENITRTRFRQYDCGNELVVGGWTYQNAEIKPVITAEGIEDSIVFDSVPTVRTQNVDTETLSRLVVYQMVKQLLKEASVANKERSQEATDKALELSLKYGFVTPLTSLVVTDIFKKPTESVMSAEFLSRISNSRGQPLLRSGFSFIYDIQNDHLNETSEYGFWLDYDDEERNNYTSEASHYTYNIKSVFSLLLALFLHITYKW